MLSVNILQIWSVRIFCDFAEMLVKKLLRYVYKKQFSSLFFFQNIFAVLFLEAEAVSETI